MKTAQPKRARPRRLLDGWRRAARIVAVAMIAAYHPAEALAAGAAGGRVRIGVFTPGLTFNPVLGGLKVGLERLGYREDRNVTFIVEDSGGGIADLELRARRLVEARPHVLFTVSTPHTLAAKAVTTHLPVVFAWVGDPVRSGLIASYSSSRNNLTGITSYSGPLAAKRLEILKEIAPGTKRVLAIVSPGELVARESYRIIETMAKKLAITLVRREATNKQEIENALGGSLKSGVDAIYHVPSTLVDVHMDVILKKAREEKIPLMTHEILMVEQGALCAFGADFRLAGAQAARLVAKAALGEKPSDIPTETPEQLLLALNITTAKVIGLKIPRNVLERADRLIE